MCRKTLPILAAFLCACTIAPEQPGYIGADLVINARFLDIPAGKVSGAVASVDMVNYCGDATADRENDLRYISVSQGRSFPELSSAGDARVLLYAFPDTLATVCGEGVSPSLSSALRLFTLWSWLGVEPLNDDGTSVFPGYWAPVGLELVYASQATTFSPFGPAGQSVAFPQGYSWLRRTCGASPGQVQMEARPIEETAEFRHFDSLPPEDDQTQSSSQGVGQSERSLVESCGAVVPAEDLGTCILFGRAQSLVWSADSASIDYLASADPQDPTQSAGLGSVRLADSVVSELAVVPFGQGLQIDSTGQLYVVGQVGGAYSILRVVLGTSPAASLVVVPLQVNASGGGEPTIPVLSPDGRWFAYSGQDGTVHVWDIQSNADQPVVDGEFSGWSPDSKLTYWSSASPETLNVVSPAAPSVPMVFDVQRNGSLSVVWNTNGPLLAQPPLAWSIESDDTSGCSFCFGLSLQDPSNGSQRQVLDASAGKIDIVSTPPVLGFMLVWARNCLGLYNTVCSYSLLRVDLTDATARTVAVAAHEYPVAVSPDNQRIAIASPTGIYVKSLVQ
jgi:hypothetical protein